MSQACVRVETFVEPTFQQNAYVVYVEPGRACWVVDPGSPLQSGRILEFLRDRGLSLEAIVLTHGHVDHIAGVPDLRRDWPDAPVWIGPEDASMLADPQENLSAVFGMPLSLAAEPDPCLLADRTLCLGPSTWCVLDTSGHTPGGRSLYCAQAGVVFVGDALFAGSIGRTDLPHSDPARLIRNIHERLLALPDETRVLSGHGPATTIGFERKWNRFLAED